MKEDFDWVSRIIASCSNESHLSYCIPIIELFDKKNVDSGASMTLWGLYFNPHTWQYRMIILSDVNTLLRLGYGLRDPSN
jgi:hypothetical protein